MLRPLLTLARCLSLATVAAMVLAAPASAQYSRPSPPTLDLRAAISKSNAYIGLMNRTLRAVDSWNRYTSWVDLKKGPTGRERYIDYGLYSLYDVRDEIKAALEATENEPRSPDLDATVKRYVEAYEVLAPLITQANGYYERKDYKADAAAEGKALHVKMVPAAEAFLRERKAFEAEMRVFRTALDRQELAAIEAADGRAVRWHIKNVMMTAGHLMDELPTNAAPVVDMKVFDERLGAYAAAVKEMDGYAQGNPGKFSAFESQPRSLLGKLRDFRDKLARSKGDARRGAGGDLTWIINDYNMMVSMSDMATRFSR